MISCLAGRLLACALAVLLIGPPTAASAKDKLTVIMSSWDLLFWGTLSASELGLFDQEDLAVELVRAGGGAKSLAAVAGGDADFNIGAPASAFRARAKGSDVMMIAPAISQYTDNVTMSEAWAKKHGLTAASPYADKLKALKGMTLAVSSVGGGASQLILFLAKQAGLDAERDITTTAIPTGDSMLAALKMGRIDGFVIPPPTGDDAIRNHGALPMFATGRGEVKALDGFVYIGVIARESWLKKNPELTVRFLRAQQRALNLIHDPATTNKARDAVWAKYHPKTDKGLFDQIWKEAEPSYPKTVELNRAMIDRIAEFVNETQTEPLDKAAAQKSWTNEYAAKALATLK
ncbi:MAG: ABC transporter substrate-binding protein [Alphaproteobacteria bacterium]|nr:ABC transporter substrate-binding protein [Alphaproteobacteria bacterium]